MTNPPPPYNPPGAGRSVAAPWTSGEPAPYASPIQPQAATGNPKAKTAFVLSLVAPLLCGPLEVLALVWGLQALKIADQNNGEGRGKATAAVAISGTFTVIMILFVLGALASSGSSGR